MPVVVNDIDQLKELVGTHVGYSDYITVTQDMIDGFAESTGDHQWIHVDHERIARESPFGKPVAHGYLSLSLGSNLFVQVLGLRGFSLGVNYGLNKVRFPAPLLVDARVRLGVEVIAVDDLPGGGVQTTNSFVFDVEGGNKPCCVAEVLFRLYP